MIQSKTLRSLASGDQIAVVAPTKDMKLVESLEANGYGKFKQKKVLLVDPVNCSTWNAILIECIEPSPELKPRGRKKNGRKIEDIIYSYATGTIDGLPAIPERNLKALAEEIVSAVR